MTNKSETSLRGRRTAALEPRRLPAQARSRQRVDAMLDAFSHLLMEQGFDSLTTHMVAERAGVPVGTLYQFFPNKFALATALSRKHRSQFGALFASAFEPPTEEATWEEAFDQLSGRIFRTLFENEVIVHAWAVIQTVPELRSLEAEIRTDFQATLARLLEPILPQVEQDRRERIAGVIYRVGYELLYATTQAPPNEREPMILELQRIIKAYIRSYLPA
jgi:AcrR family transcriptional regulator